DEAQKTADLLYEVDANKTNVPKKSFQLTGGTDTVNLRMVVNQTKAASLSDSVWYIMGSFFSEKVFEGKPVNVELTDDHFKTMTVYHYRKMDLGEESSGSGQ